MAKRSATLTPSTASAPSRSHRHGPKSGSARRANGHLQAIGRDAQGRKQYRYHPRWREVRDEAKYGRMIAFASALPKIRARASQDDLRRRGLPREKVLAAVVRAAGEDPDPRRQRGVRPAEQLLRPDHAAKTSTSRIRGATVHFEFRGKSGKEHAIDLDDRRLAKIVKQCQDLPGQELFQYVDDDGKVARHRLGRRQRIPAGDQPARSSRRRISAPGPARCWRRWRCRSSRRFDSKAARKKNIVSRRRSGRAATGQHQGGLPQVLHPPGRDRRVPGRHRWPSRCGKAAGKELARSIHALSPEEAAVLALLQQNLSHPACARHAVRPGSPSDPSSRR